MISIAQFVGIIVLLAGIAGLLCVWKVPAIGLFWAKLKDKKTTGYALYGAIAIIGIALILLYPVSTDNVVPPVPTITPTPIPTPLMTVPVASNGESQAVVEEKMNKAISEANRVGAITQSSFNSAKTYIIYPEDMLRWLNENRPMYVDLVSQCDTVVKYALLDKEFYAGNDAKCAGLDAYASLAQKLKHDSLVNFNSLVDNYNPSWGQYYGYAVDV